MLDSKSSRNFLAPEPQRFEAEALSTAEQFANALGVVRRQIWIVLGFLALGVILAGVVLAILPPKYTATATLLIDSYKLDVIQQPAVSNTMSYQQTGAMESQVELLLSDEVALQVIREFDLAHDPRLMGTGEPGFLRTLLHRTVPGLFPAPAPPTEAERERRALKAFEQALSAGRAGVTYAIDIRFTSGDRAFSAQMANAVAGAYIALQRTSGYDAARRASDWLEKRVPELRAQSEAAQNAVVEYKNQHTIVETTAGVSVEDQRVTDLDAKLNTARDDMLKAKALSEQLAKISDTVVPGEILVATANNGGKTDVFNDLRRQYFDAASQEAALSAKLGAGNPAIVSLRNKKSQLRDQLTEEIKRLKTTSERDYAAAVTREATLRAEFDAAVSQAQAASQTKVKLRELEASARAHQDLYNTFLSRYNASLQQAAASPVAEASIITAAVPPLQRDYKTGYQIAALFPVGALALGVVLALIRELFSGRVFLTSKSVQAQLGIPCLGLLPKHEKGRRGRRRPAPQPVASGPRSLVRGDRELSWTVVDYPLTRFSEGVRSIKLAIDMEAKSTASRVFGITSAMPGEGKSTTILALGQLFARNGAAVIVVDCDLRNPSLTRSLAPGAASGVSEAAYGRASLKDVVWTDPVTQMAFLPALPHAGPPDPPTILASAEMKQLFNELRKQYDFVFVDLSPIAPVIDVCATTDLVDAYVLVIEWGQTTVDTVQHALRAAPLPAQSMLGAVLNKADVKRLPNYDPYQTGYYFQNERR